jgi:hypothetical protein
MDKKNIKIDDMTIYHSVRLIMHHVICAIEECDQDIIDEEPMNSVWQNVPDEPSVSKKKKHITFNVSKEEYIIPNCRDYLSVEERQRIWYTPKEYTIMQRQASNEVFIYMSAYPATNYRHCIKKLWTEYNFIPSE